MKTIFALSALSLAIWAPLSQLPAQRVPVQKSEVEHVGQVPRIFEVRDLLQEFGREYDAPQLGVSRPWRASKETVPLEGSSVTAAPSLEDSERLYERGAQALVDIVKRHIQPQLVEPREHVECAGSGSLVAHLMPTQHAWIDSFLRRLRDFDGFIEIETRIVEAPAAVLDELGLVGEAVLNSDTGLSAIDASIKSRANCNLLSTPKIMTAPGARASLSTTEDFKYVQDWVIEKVEPGAHEIAVPQIAVILEGSALDVRALPLPSDLFAVEMHMQSAQVRRPLRTATVTIGAEPKPAEIALPESDSVKFHGTLLLASGSSAILRGLSVDRDKAIAVIVTLRRIPRERR